MATSGDDVGQAKIPAKLPAKIWFSGGLVPVVARRLLAITFVNVRFLEISFLSFLFRTSSRALIIALIVTFYFSWIFVFEPFLWTPT